MSESRYHHYISSVLLIFNGYAIYRTIIHPESKLSLLWKLSRIVKRNWRRVARDTPCQRTSVTHCCGVAWPYTSDSRLRADSNWHGGSIRRAGELFTAGSRRGGGGGDGRCGLSRNRRARSKSIEATWTRDGRSLCHAPWKAARPREFDERERIDNNSAEAASEKDLTLWTLTVFRTYSLSNRSYATRCFNK